MLPERFAVLPRLALADLRHEWGMALCYVAALAAILTPLLVLDGLRAGVIQGLTDELRSNPSKLRIHLPGTLQLTPETVATIGALDGIGYIEPMSRSIAARLLLAGPGGAVDTVDLLPSSAGDPLLRAGGRARSRSDRAQHRSRRAVRGPHGRPADRPCAAAPANGRPARPAVRGRRGRAGRFFARPPGAGSTRGRRSARGVSRLVRAAGPRHRRQEPCRAAGALREPADLCGRPGFGRAARPALRSSFGLQVRAAEDEVRRIRALDRNLGAVFSLIGAGRAAAGFVTALGREPVGQCRAQAARARHPAPDGRPTRLALVAFPLTHGLAIAALGLRARRRRRGPGRAHDQRALCRPVAASARCARWCRGIWRWPWRHAARRRRAPRWPAASRRAGSSPPKACGRAR